MTTVADPPPSPAAAARRPRKRPRTILWSCVTAAVVLALFVAVLATRKAATDVQAGSPLLGHSAPALAGPDQNGHHVAISQFGRKWVLVNFFATWCGPCQQEHPDLITFNDQHRTQGDAVLVGVVYDPHDAANVGPFLKKHGGDWPVIRDDSAQVEFGTTGVPETFIIDPNGYVVTRITGRVTTSGLNTILQRLESESA